MARPFNLTQMIADARALADMQSTSAQQYITDTELTENINYAWCELYDLLIDSGGQEYFMSSQVIPVVTNQSVYTLNPDFYRILGVDCNLNSNQAITLQPYLFSERNLYKSVYAGGWGVDYNLRYRVVGGSNIEFIPIPLNTVSLTVWYIPAPPVLTVLSTPDGVSGWEQYIVVDAAIQCLLKEESDVTMLMARKEGLRQRILANAPYRDASRAERPHDVDLELLTAWPWA